MPKIKWLEAAKHEVRVERLWKAIETKRRRKQWGWLRKKLWLRYRGVNVRLPDWVIRKGRKVD